MRYLLKYRRLNHFEFCFVQNTRKYYAYSTDGAVWTEEKGAPTSDIGCIIWGNGIWVAIRDLLEIYYSIDGGDTWKKSSRMLDPLNIIGFMAGYIHDITYGNGKFVAVGKRYYGNNFYEPTIVYSMDGKEWTAAEDSVSAFSNDEFSYIVWGNNKFVALNGNDKIAHSPDGITWTVENNSSFDNGDVIRDIAWGGGKFVAVGYNLKELYNP
jgi:hypothetical protein